MYHSPSSPEDPHFDFAALLEQSFQEIDDVKPGEILSGTILALDEQGIIVDLGLKRDGVVPRSDLEAIGSIDDYTVGQQVMVMVVRPEDKDGNLLVSLQQARATKDWEAAQAQMEQGELHTGVVMDANQGGLIVPYGELRGFVPASHVVKLPRGLDHEARIDFLACLIGQELMLKIIEVNPRRRRLVLSQREAEREHRDRIKEHLLEELEEGNIVQGKVSSLRDFGAFVDLGGADGLIHVSELAWRRIRHPGEVLNVGDEVEVYILQLDREEKRIGLSLKRLQPNPWAEIEETHQIGQLVEGTISRVVSFGAFVELESGVEALLHVSQMGDPPPQNATEILKSGERIVSKIVSLEPQRQRMGLSLKDLAQQEQATASPEEVEHAEPEIEELQEAVAEADTA